MASKPVNKRVLVSALLCALALVCIPTRTSAQSTSSQLQEARRRAQSVKSNYQRIAEAYAEGETQLGVTRERLDRSRSDIGRTRDEMSDLQGALKGRVRAMYRMRGIGFFQMLLAADSFRDLNVRLTTLQRQSLADEDIILQLRRKRAELELKERTLAQQEGVRTAQQKDLQAQGRRLTISLQQASELVNQLRGRLAREEIARLFQVSTGAGGGGRVVPLSSCAVDPPNVVTNSWGAPRGGGSRRHQGNDIMAPFGTPVRAVNGGTISRTGSGGLGGLSIYLWDGSTEYYYAHLQRIDVRSGQKVAAGALVGTNGDTGNAEGGPPHVHFEIHPGGGGAIDPYPSLSRVC